MSLDAQIEAVLFYKTEPYEKSALAKFFAVSIDEINAALELLSTRLQTGGVRLIMTDTTVELRTAPELASLVESLRKEELKGDIGKAGAETLAIILYRGPLSRAEVDRIRGVNSNFIIRNLLVRGLIERREHPTDNRSFIYAATGELLAHLGVTQKETLPDFAQVMDALDAFEKSEHEAAEKDVSLV